MSQTPNLIGETPRPEIELMLHCARTRVEAGRAERMRRLVRTGIDWNFLFENARRHHVVPLVCRNLTHSCSAELPGEVDSALRAQTAATLGRNMALTGQLFKILARLQSHGVTAAPFKGPALAAGAFGHLALREFGDLDILVRRRDVPAARETLVSMGLSPYRRLSPRQEDLHFRYESAFEYLGDNGLMVELHWELTSWRSLFPLDPESLWDRLDPVSVAGRTVYTLPPHDLLLYLCAHGAKHRWERLQWVCDIAELSQAREWPWTEILNRAASSGVRRLLLVALSLAEVLLDVEFPAAVRVQMEADSVARELAIQCSRRILHPDRTPPAGDADANQLEFFYAAKERWRDKVRYLLGRGWSNILWSDKDAAFVDLPRSLHFLYYAVKPLRVLCGAGPRPAQDCSSLRPEPTSVRPCFPKD